MRHYYSNVIDTTGLAAAGKVDSGAIGTNGRSILRYFVTCDKVHTIVCYGSALLPEHVADMVVIQTDASEQAVSAPGKTYRIDITGFNYVTIEVENKDAAGPCDCAVLAGVIAEL